MRPRVHAALVASIAVIAVGACRHVPPADGTRTATDAGIATNRPSGRGTRVIVDVSQSNRGFALPASVALETLHRVLESTLSAQQLNAPFQRCRLDTTLHCAAVPLTAAQLRDPALYAGRDASLERVLRRDHDDDALDPFALSVLVTDGFQSRRSPPTPDAADDVACSTGADPGCIGALLRQRVDDGYGVWVIRLWMPFEGRYFAERRLDVQSFDRVQAHLAALANEPAWESVHFAASNADLASESGPFQFVGARPLLLFVLSRDPPRARAFVDEFTRRMARERITSRRREDDIASSEWAPFEGFTARIETASRVDQGGAADDVLLDPPRHDATAEHIPVHCSLHGHARVALGGSLLAGALAPPAYARLDFAWRRASQPGATIAIPTEEIAPRAGPIRGTTTVDCTTLPRGRTDAVIGVWGHWTLDDTVLADQWFVQDSADTSFETPERVYGLETIARAVIGDAMQREGFLDRAVFEIERE